ncbi:MAG: hypothetical protein M3Q68_00825, partial [Actinomycetota bacterium]|nr:hypothetical protein [Actinomycetota bacterium]
MRTKKIAARRQRLVAASTMVGLALALVAPEIVQAPQQVRAYTYVARDSYVFGPDLAAQALAQETGQHVAPLGTIDFVPSGSEVTVNIDDVGTTTGLLDVTVGQRTYE